MDHRRQLAGFYMRKASLEISSADGFVTEIHDQEFIPCIGDTVMVAKDSGVVIEKIVHREFRYMEDTLALVVVYTEPHSV